MFDGDPASPEAIDSILSAMQIGMELAKRRTKKNTHRKNIKRTDVYGHKKKSESDRSPIPVTESF